MSQYTTNCLRRKVFYEGAAVKEKIKKNYLGETPETIVFIECLKYVRP